MKAKKIKEVKKLLGIETDLNKEYPLFWTIDKEGYYVAEGYKLNTEEFEKIRKYQPCLVEEKTY